jgi:amine acid ABC transporter, permease protein, 3-TM region, His/Glu/Gln/Arg/opine family
MTNYISIERIKEFFPIILGKFPVTLSIVLIATVIGFLLGLVIAITRIKAIPILDKLATVFVSFVRGTPLIVQLFIILYGFPIVVQDTIGIDIYRWDKIYFVFVTYGLNQAAFMSEIFRGSILSVPVGQSEAAYSVGLTGYQTMMRIIIPQAMKSALPSLGTLFISLFQETALAFTVGIIDVMGQAKLLAVSSRHTIDPYTVVAIIFIIVSFLLEKIFSYLNKYLSYGNKRLNL